MKIDKQELARQMQWLLWAVIWLKGDNIVDLRTLSDKMWVITSKIEEDIFYFGNKDQQKKMDYKFHFLSLNWK